MPRVINDSDEEVESKSSTRRTRASSATIVTDSPARRTTRGNKPLAITESSPESLDDSNSQRTVRTTRSRAATLDKSTTAGIAKNLRSRKNSASSNLSETIDLELDTTQKRVTRKTAATAAAVGTPTKTNLRSRNLRAGSEAKSTPPATRSTRVTRASSVDPINTPNETLGTPVRRRTRASIVPVQQTVTEEQEAKNEILENLNNTVVEIDENSENESVSSRGKSNKKIAKNRKHIGKDTSTGEQSNLDTSKTIEGNMTDKSCTSNDTSEESTLKALTSHSIISMLESVTSKKKENVENIDLMTIPESSVLSTDQSLIKSDAPRSNSNDNNYDSVKSKAYINDDECEHVDVENFTLTDDSIDVVDSPKIVDIRDTLVLDIKDSYVKLNRTNLVEKIVSSKVEESKNNDNNLPVTMNDSDSVNQNNVITNAKTAIVLVNDFVKSNEYFNNMKDQKIFDSGISLNNKEDVNSNTSVHNSDDQLSIITIDDTDEVLSLKLSSPNAKETYNDKLMIEALPDDENNDSTEDTDKSDSVNANSNSLRNFSFEKSDVCLKENVVLESKLKSENFEIVGEKNNKMECSGKVNIVYTNKVDEIGDEINSISENIQKVDASEMINASADTVIISSSLHRSLLHNDSDSVDRDDNATVSANVESLLSEIDLTAAELKDETKNEIAESSEIKCVCDNMTKSKVGPDENIITEKNDSVDVIKSCNTETSDFNSVKTVKSLNIIDTNEQVKPMETSMSESNFKENHDITNSCVFNETNSNEIEPKLSSEDKNGVPSAVTDADGENASPPTKEEETYETNTDTTSTKSPGKSKRKSKTRVIDSDLDESVENLFQDIPAEEWSEEQSKKKSNESKRMTEVGDLSIELGHNSINMDESVIEESRSYEDNNNQTKKSRKSISNKERGKSAVEITTVANETGNQEADSSLLKKLRKSLDRKRESGQSSDSGIQDNNKTIVENDRSDNDMNESPNKSRRSLDKSLEANQSLSAICKNDSVTEKMSKSLIDDKSSSKSRKSLNSIQYNVSVFNTFLKKNDSLSEDVSSSLNTSNASKKSSSNSTRKSIEEEKIEENSEAEGMAVDQGNNSESEINKASESLIQSRKSLNKSRVSQSPSNNDSVAENPSVSLNTSKIANRLSLDKSLNKSSRKSLPHQAVNEDEIVDDEEIVNVVDSNQSVEEIINNKSLSKSPSFSNESSALRKNNSLSENLSTSLNDSKKLKKRLSKKFNESTCQSSVKEQNEDEASESEEMEVDVVNDKSPNKSRKSLNELSSNKSFNQKEQFIADADAEVSFKDKDKSLKKTFNKKSANKSLDEFDVVVEDESEMEVEAHEDGEENNKSTGKSCKANSKSPIKVSTVKDAGKSDESMAESNPKKKKGQEAATVSTSLDRSLQKSIERMKFSNPPKHDISIVVQVSSGDDSDDSEIPNFMFKLSNEQETEDSSDGTNNDVDSDVEREYNLGGKDIANYSDDDVPGDECRVSEEESSDNEDDGADLEDFVVPDQDVDDEEEDEESEDEDEDGDENENEEDEDEDENENEADEDESAEVEDSNRKKVSVSKVNASVNNSRSTVKNSSAHLRRSDFSQSSGSESDDEATEAENKSSKESVDFVGDSEKLLKDSKKIEEQSIMLSNKINGNNNTSLQKKNKSMDKTSKSGKSNLASSSASGSEGSLNESQMQLEEKSTNISAKNKSLNLSKSAKDKSTNISRSSTNDKSVITLHEYKPGKNKSVLIVNDDETESSSSESDEYEEASRADEDESMQIASPLETASESEDGEDYYRVVNGESTDTSLLKPKSKKLIDCSTPKPGAANSTDLSITASRRKSGSLNDLTHTKMMSSRQSISEAASKSMKLGDTSMRLKDDVDIVATPETVTKTRQAWKLIPLNQTAHPAAEDTPGTKFLKKAKLNDSFPVLESMKSSDLMSVGKKSKKAIAGEAEPSEVMPSKNTRKSKKRKLLDMSNVQSVEEDSMCTVSKKNKKRARFDDSTVSAANEQEEAELVEQSNEKKSKRAHAKEATEFEEVEGAQKSKKKNKIKAKQREVQVKEVANAPEALEAPEEVEEKPKKKRTKKLSRARGADEEDQSVEPEKPNRKKSKLSTEFGSEQVVEQRSKEKSNKQVPEDSPESVGFEQARRLALNEMQQEVEGIKAVKEALRNKSKHRADRGQEPKQTKSLKRLPEDILENLTDGPVRRPDKRQKLSRGKERSVTMPSKSMFSPGKDTPDNLQVDDGYVPLSSAGGTTQFAVIKLQKVKRVAKKSAAALNFRDKMLARNQRMPTSMYLSYLKKQKTKSSS